jgi:hypothetical protein
MKPDSRAHDTTSDEYEGQSRPDSESRDTNSADIADDKDEYLPPARR